MLFRSEVKRLQAVELAVGDDPLARQTEVEDRAGAFAGERKYGSAANLPARPSAASRVHKPTDADMGPHNFGGGEARPKGASRTSKTGRPRGRKRG